MPEPLPVPVDLIGQSGLYNVPDPLLRRLRLEDAQGIAIKNLDKYFAEKEVLVLYAGSEYGETAVIYVSVDTDPQAPLRVLQGKPWLRMTFNDNSDFATVGKDKGQEVEMEEVARGEDFVQAGEMEIGMENVVFGVEEYQNEYVRPLSRAAVTHIMRVFSTPSVAVYHLPSHTLIAKNLKPSVFNPSSIDKTYDTWRKGGNPSLRFIVDVVRALRLPLIGLLFALIYQIAIRFGGDQYHVIPRIMDGMAWNQNMRLSPGNQG
ncbi:hypothetical protein I315_06580 [Cryptococcus gattii Ru294]|uniref:Uncharacterized protein n=2 Tax=Cryptococcus gattii TaxID=37769 RepID=E6R824_CRYGW|nr:Hypothetical protein CGB_F3070C [Cryptococcus gattii WM276]ADV23010.1 Hypothetical protein CGB_F3070C [Cryptococcus gattii WM276]KIR50974.1 hypothetical protein I315_06580 [Cryptococcus gattii Ru294]KIR82619.1 hypothetical protein I306_00216 [Cryptococcus gattii EJB2]KIY33709.1 hypothetical protein I305_03596 [Cryptococcus gattii E566]